MALPALFAVAVQLAAIEADERVVLVIIRGTGGQLCPDDDELRDRVRQRIGSEPFDDDETTTRAPTARNKRPALRRKLRVALAKERKELVARVTLFSDTGERVGRRELRGAVDCEALADDLVLALAIAIDPLLLVRRAPPPEPPVEVAEDDVDKPVTLASADDAFAARPAPLSGADLPEVRVDETDGPLPFFPAPAGISGRALLSVVAGLGVVAVPSLRAEASFDYGILDLDAGLRFDVPSRYPIDAVALIDVVLIAPEGGPCVGSVFDLPFIGATTLDGCVFGEVGALVAQGVGLAGGRSVTAPWVAVGARGAAVYPLYDTLGLVVGVDATVPLIRAQFVDDVTRQTFFQPGPYAGAFGIGLELRIR